MNIASISSLQQTTAASAATTMRTDMKEVMGAVAKELGMSDSELSAALKSGQSLADVAQSKGVSAADLKATIAASLQSTSPNLSATQLSAIADRIVSHKGGGHHHHGGPAAAATADPTTDPASAAVSGLTGRTDGSNVSIRL
jgi:hypothetical protein